MDAQHIMDRIENFEDDPNAKMDPIPQITYADQVPWYVEVEKPQAKAGDEDSEEEGLINTKEKA